LALLAVLCLANVVLGQDLMYDGSLQPFSYAELQATVMPSGTPAFISPFAREHPIPQAFPFEQPAVPAEVASKLRSSDFAPSFIEQNPYDANEFVANRLGEQMSQRHNILVERALQTPPASLLESRASLYRPVDASNPAGTDFAVMDAMPTQPIAGADQQQQQQQQLSASSAAPATGAFAPSQADPPSMTAIADAARFRSTSGAASTSQDTALPQSSVPPPQQSSAVPPPPMSSQAPPASISQSQPMSSLGSNSLSSGSGSLSGSMMPDPASLSSELSEVSESGSSVTPVTGPPKPLHKCKPTTKRSCVVDFDPKSIPWTVKTVPHLEEGSAPQSSSQGSSQSGSQSGMEPPQEEYSSNPQIARAQKEFYEKQKEVTRERQWILEVRRIIDEYNLKIKNVQRHLYLSQGELNKSRKNIVDMIKAEKQAKLEKELQAALESLQKLESTSSALNYKMSELAQTKLGLKNTIKKIQHVIGSNPAMAGSRSLMQLSEVIKTSPDEEKFQAQVAANNHAKQLFTNLLQLVSKAHLHTEKPSKPSRELKLRQHARAPRGVTLAFDDDEDEKDNAQQGGDDEVNAISSRASAIASKYAQEENKRLHLNLPLRALSAREYKKAGDDDMFLD